MKFSEYTTKNIEETFRELKSSENGISNKEVKKRLEIYGFNEVKTKEVGLFGIFLRQFKSPFFYLLFIAATIAFFVGEKIDSIVILIFVFINVILGFLQEGRAYRAVFLLKRYFPEKVRVLREGSEKIIDKKFLVPGDIVLLETGSIVPADLRVLKTENFLVDESILSGESVPVSKFPSALLKETKEIFEAKNIVFAGTSIISGKAKGIVIATGKNTALGEITKLVSGIARESAYEKSLIQFSKIILRIVVLTIIFVFLTNLIINSSRTNFSEFLIFSIALIVSILPEALPVVVTFALSNGALKMAKEKVVVKRLSAIEDLGDIEILCSDKTGTLTENKLRLERIFAKDKEKCLLYGLLASAYVKEEIESVQNPFDLALFREASQEIKKELKKTKAISEIPFDPFRLKNSILLKTKEGKRILIVRGAPEVILKISSKFDQDQDPLTIEREIKKEGEEGKRVLAVAFKELDKNEISKEDEKDLTFLGYFSFQDPLKKTAREAIQLAKKLGLKIKILTGDSKEVAGKIAKEIGLIEDTAQVILGEDLESLSGEDFERTCQDFSVFARVSPKTKLEIISALQKKFEVGFLGEGINDTPALKIANLGIVVKEAADVPREVADVVLLEKDLRVIVNGIKIGRNIFSNINKYIKCALASNFGNFYSIAVISLLIPVFLKKYFLPMLPIQILLGNLLSDFPLIAVATDGIDIEELRKPKLYQLNRVIPLIISLALVSTIFDFIFFAIFYKFQPAIIQTLWFIESILTEIFLIFVIRTRHFFLQAKRPSMPLTILALIDAAVIVFLPFTAFGKNFFHFVSPPIASLFVVFFLVLNYFITSEAVKLIYYRYFWKNSEVKKK